MQIINLINFHTFSWPAQYKQRIHNQLEPALLQSCMVPLVVELPEMIKINPIHLEDNHTLKLAKLM